ncbi:MAG: sugar transferase [Clostridiaceae bacterium]
MYAKYLKRLLDVFLSACALVVLSPLYLVLAVLIKFGSSGPVLFKQKRVGIHKTYFNILKFRTMRIDTPRDVPTHLLENPEQYITKVGKFLRKTSLDELPQIAQIFTGKMSIIGPRPALWNQYDLIAERDNYGANDIRPGLTGWAQINGRDELEISIKAKLDGEYVRRSSFLFDCKCFFKTVFSVLKHDGVVEGSTYGHEKEKRVKSDAVGESSIE